MTPSLFYYIDEIGDKGYKSRRDRGPRLRVRDKLGRFHPIKSGIKHRYPIQREHINAGKGGDSIAGAIALVLGKF